MDKSQSDTALEERVWMAALAGLLHDIGKFSQRAGVAKGEQWDPEVQAQIKYDHALRSYDFFKFHVPEQWRTSLSGVAYHHAPRNLAEHWVQLADWLASAERVPGTEEDVDASEPILRTVFSQVRGYSKPAYWRINALQVNDHATIFPRNEKDADWQKQYTALWSAFETRCGQRGLTADTKLTLTAYLENLLAVLQEFVWGIPSAFWKSAPDVSLYDHLRTTAALAACLAADARDKTWCQGVEEDLQNHRPSRDVALLVGGDLSGIQDFIYALTSSGAAKSLRARSFYLHVLSEVIALNMLEMLGLPLTNLIYVGGGGFHALVPCRAEHDLPDIAQMLTDKLMRAHQGKLGLTLVWEQVRADEFGAFNHVYERLGRALNRKKRQPFAQASATELAKQIGEPLTLGGNAIEFCEVTGDDWDMEKRGDERKTRFVWSLEKLGQQLHSATHLILLPVDASPLERPHTWQDGLRYFGFDVTILADHDQPTFDSHGLVRVWRLDPACPRERERTWLASLQPQVVLTDHPVARLVPLDESRNVMTFDELSEKQSKGIKRWGVLRMDVDNLGALFRDGFGDKASLGRIASLSFALRVFFEGWLPQLAGDDLKDKLYIQYAGGDDLFVVGAWDALPQFAQRVRESFREFTSGNPAFTLSGGISIVESKFPIYQAARLAGEAEDTAKAFRAQKDAIRFLEHTGDWQSFGEIKRNAEELAGWRGAHLIPAALFQTILALRQQIIMARDIARRKRQPKPVYGRWMWMAAYQLKRVEDAVKREHTEVKNGIEKIQRTFLTPGDDSERWGVAARWAQFLTRGGE